MRLNWQQATPVLATILAASLASSCSAVDKNPASPIATSSTTSAPSPSQTAKPLSALQLDHALLTQSDVPEQFNIITGSTPEAAATPRKAATASNPACQPILDLAGLGGGSATSPEADESFQDSAQSLAVGGTMLVSSTIAEAQQFSTSLSRALDACPSVSFQSQGKQVTCKITKLKAPNLGDESLAFKAIATTGEIGPPTHDVDAFVRVGSTIASFSIRDAGVTPKLPADLTTLQIQKLKAVQKSVAGAS
ncbi:MAG: hypothetical protein QOF84_2630 [Streptomyces sp.]|nr:hypothetical protein [Streptomyces sp.]